MQKIQESKIKMSRSVSGILNSYEEIVMRTPGLNAAHDALDNLIAETERYNRGQLDIGAELTAQKNNARLVLETAIIQICAALAAYATVSNEPGVKKLKDKYQVSDSEITKMRDMPLFSYAYTLYDDAKPYATKLEPFATAEDIEQLKEKADNFNALLPQRRVQVSQSSLSTQNLEDAIAQIDLLLNDTMDVLVKPWETKEPDFFKAYKNARAIVDAASRKTKNAEDPTNV